MALIQCNFFSTSLMRTVPINVILPTDKVHMYSRSQIDEHPFKTLYFLHGILGNYTDVISGTHLQSWAQDKNLAVVMPSGDNSFYVDKISPGERYGTFIQRELVEFTRKSFPLSKKREDTYIGGLSMGGYGAIINGLSAPETFGAICALSTAMIMDLSDSLVEKSEDIFISKEYFELVFGDLTKIFGSNKDYNAVAKRLAASDSEKPRFFMACGTEDKFFESNHLFKEKLISLGFDVTWVGDTGKHDWKFWDKYIKEILQWLPLGEDIAGVSSGNIG